MEYDEKYNIDYWKPGETRQIKRANNKLGEFMKNTFTSPILNSKIEWYLLGLIEECEFLKCFPDEYRNDLKYEHVRIFLNIFFS